jgi:HD-GYP domain-containing protein (c-di-GMP phosphodiesterase class II)
MSKMTRIEVDAAFLAEFLGEYADIQGNLEKALTRLRQEPGDDEAMNALFRSVHSIKSNLRMMELNQLSDCIHALESLLTRYQQGEHRFTDALTVLVSQITEPSKELARLALTANEDPAHGELVSGLLLRLLEEPDKPADAMLVATIGKLDDSRFYGKDYPAEQILDFLEQSPAGEQPAPNRQDLTFFADLMRQVESYFPHWKNRSARVLKLALGMNRERGSPVDEQQLEAAAYLHDIGMCFVPPQALFKDAQLTDDEYALMQTHCELGYQLMSRLPYWEPAALMIRQHHERCDGSGYPAGLVGEQICDGARIIAIADTFAAITLQEKSDGKKRPALYALLEINRNAGRLYDDDWVEAFNRVIRQKD